MLPNIEHTQFPLLELNNLSITFNNGVIENNVIRGIDLCLYKGKITALVGETGSGKTVTGLAMMRLLKGRGVKIEGSYKYGEMSHRESFSIKRSQLIGGKEIAMIFQDPLSAFNPVRKIKNQVDDIISHVDIDQRFIHENRFKALLDDLELTNTKRLLNSYPHQVSGGELQRLMVATSLLQNPKILIADEPAASLDFVAKNQLYNLFLRLVDKYEMSILIITHDLSNIAEISTDIYILDKGKIIEHGLTKDIISKPSQNYTIGLINSILSNSYKHDRILNRSNSKYENRGEIISRAQHEKHLYKLLNNEIILSADNLSVKYILSDWTLRKGNEFIALSNISFKLNKGECLGVFGNSGSGKSSLLSTIVKLVDYEGEISFHSNNINSLSTLDKINYNRKTQYIFQNSHAALNPRLSIRKTLLLDLKMLYPNLNKESYVKKMKRLIGDVQLDWDLIDRFPHELSGGQKQRVCIARALVYRPELLLCDEIVSALDVSVQADILNLLKDLMEQYGLSIIFVTHDLSVIRFISDRVLQLEKGKSVFYGNVFDINSQSI